MSAALRVRPLDRARRADFLALHSDACAAGWCRCVAWWVPTWDGWSARTEAQNLALRDALLARGESDGFLGYAADGAPPVGGARSERPLAGGAPAAHAPPIAWCQVGPRDRLAKLGAQMELEPDPSAWAITCLFVDPEHRRRGVASALVAAVIAELEARGVRRLEAYARSGPELEPGDLWTGPRELFLRAGFRVVREASPGFPRAVLRRD